MKIIGKIAVAAIAASSLLTGSVYAQTDCRKKCNDTYQACQKAGTAEEKCRAAWIDCKKKCK
ncbi:hypothetical protein ATDW_23230 [Asticcacaulis sp. DW145]|jgi:hypothetical protein|uniref:Uncharacterized protein n=1 Tax=Asticcacaulis currens TaxID=2984210 RepID=A0ABT5IHG1_9CAUL|nr:hypothetical protein [Asticcacaulis currens]MDC7695624.1 hypothetical protein [Asticcacaulis currens]BEV11827.1 hypothetical protein ATDW_23230 [Asticcacaulis sp. DW145]